MAGGFGGFGLAMWAGATSASAQQVTLASDPTGSYTTLADAVAASIPGDTLTAVGTFDESVHADHAITLVGDGATVVTSDGTGVTLSVFGMLIASGVTFENRGDFAAVHADDLVLRDSVVIGGADAVETGVIERVTFTDGRYLGGGLLVGSGVTPAVVEVTDAVFDATSAEYGGGAMYLWDGGSATCTRCTFRDIVGNGAVIHLRENATVNVVDSLFDGSDGAPVTFDGAGYFGAVRTEFVGTDTFTVFAPSAIARFDNAVLRIDVFAPSGSTTFANCAFVGPKAYMGTGAITFVDTAFVDGATDGGAGTVSFAAYGTSAELQLDAALVPAPGSALIDAGDPAILDPDGSRSDIGITGGPAADPRYFVDADGDGVVSVRDCDDGDAYLALPGPTFADLDGDGHGDPATLATTCPGPGRTLTSDDCDDGDPGRWPGNVELCDTIDQNCVFGDEPTMVGYFDADVDGFGGGPGVDVCPGTPGYVAAGGDCADDDPSRSPGVVEVCDAVDQNCVDGDEPTLALHPDLDGDGFGDPGVSVEACAAYGVYLVDDTDCDDASAAVNPGATEQCDGVDDDCDGVVDDAGPTSVWYADADGDGFGDPATAEDTACPEPDAVANGDDCDDADPSVGPCATTPSTTTPGGTTPGGTTPGGTTPGNTTPGGTPGDDDDDDAAAGSTEDPGADPADDGHGCGCDGTGGAGVGFGALALAGLVVRRRRGARPV